ncbi:MAG: hypothetical protein ABSG15_03260 [FCB group bacterium]|jgi:hypothetical protein
MLEELKSMAYDAISSINKVMTELDNELRSHQAEDYSVQIKAIDDSIKKMEKLGVKVPNQLIQIKLELINKNDTINVYSELKSSIIEKLNEILPSSNTNNYKQSSQMGNRYNGANNIDYIYKTINSFTFEGKQYLVKTWKEMFISICELMYKRHKESFERILEIQGKRKRFIFTRNSKLLRYPEQIDGTNIYAETNLSANSCYRNAQNVLINFGYDPNVLLIQTRER